jgi:hypothetical protein
MVHIVYMSVDESPVKGLEMSSPIHRAGAPEVGLFADFVKFSCRSLKGGTGSGTKGFAPNFSRRNYC